MHADPRTAGNEGRGSLFAQCAGLGAVLAGEFGLYCWATARHAAWPYPRWYDQLQYLREGYAAFDSAQAGGAAAGIRHALLADSPQGSLHALLALAAFKIAGPGRAAALAVNMAAFIALQLSTFVAARRLSRSWPVAWAAAGLLACLFLPWSGGPGSAADFRLDWMASCAYGTALAVALCSGGFRSMRWSTAFGAAAGVTLLVRHLTVVYFAGAFVIILVAVSLRPPRGRAVLGMFLAAAVAAAAAGWSFWRARLALLDYYWVGHIAGPERALRDVHLGLFDSGAWLLRELAFNHLGIPALVIGLGAAASLRAFGGAPSGRGGDRVQWIIAAAFAAAPGAVLIVHPEKATVPVSIMIAPAAWVFILGWIHLARGRPLVRTRPILVAAAAAGLAVFALDQVKGNLAAPDAAELREVNGIADFTYFRSQEKGLTNPRVAVTWELGSLNADVLSIVGRERHVRRLPFTATLPTGLFETDPALVMKRLSESDFVFLVTRGPSEWPFDRQMTAMLPQMRDWCERNLELDGTVSTGAYDVSLFERRSKDRSERRSVTLGSSIANSLGARGWDPPVPPALPAATWPAQILWPAGIRFGYRLSAAFSPLTVRSRSIPAGLGLDKDGLLQGVLERPGKYVLPVTLENPLGQAQAVLKIEAVASSWDARVDAPSEVRVGDEFTVEFQTCDSAGKNDLIDINDLPAGKVLGRIAAGEEERFVWSGHFTARLEEPGAHDVRLRFVRYEPKDASYTYIDRTCVVLARR